MRPGPRLLVPDDPTAVLFTLLEKLGESSGLGHVPCSELINVAGRALLPGGFSPGVQFLVGAGEKCPEFPGRSAKIVSKPADLSGAEAIHRWITGKTKSIAPVEDMSICLILCKNPWIMGCKWNNKHTYGGVDISRVRLCNKLVLL